MTINCNQPKNAGEDSQDVPIDLEFEYYLFEVFFNDRVENEIQRMMENCRENLPYQNHLPNLGRTPTSANFI